MTAPTQPDPRVQELLYDLTRAGMNLLTGVNEDYVTDAIAKFVDGRIADANAKFVRAELAAGRERETVQYQYLGEPAERPTDGITLQNGEVITWRDKQWHLWDAGYTRTAWYLSDLIQCVTFCCSDNDLRALLALQQRENAETIKELKERVETAEAANTELDNARKSAEQSARDLRENNATLRAELDAIKGAQVPFIAMRVMEGGAFSVVPGPAFAPIQIGVSTPMYLHPAPPHNPFAAFIDALKADRDMQWYYHCNVAMAACDKGVPHDQANAAAFLFMERLLGEYTPLHAIPEYTPAPPLPVVGACVVNDKGDMFSFGHWPQERNEKNAVGYARECGGVAYRTYRDVTPLPTEGGK